MNDSLCSKALESITDFFPPPPKARETPRDRDRLTPHTSHGQARQVLQLKYRRLQKGKIISSQAGKGGKLSRHDSLFLGGLGVCFFFLLLFLFFNYFSKVLVKFLPSFSLPIWLIPVCHHRLFLLYLHNYSAC